ncbi:hypothetical protein PGIGA_G00061390 [Pangasianodon gigas]|uniref:Uncharacterized protein n=1 Tax=Pangasianodon gigas TaxID=30993 RepID=A0ACC5X5E5_PANGG|nr:hypothetical protein [Pangasianodon gigas]
MTGANSWSSSQCASRTSTNTTPWKDSGPYTSRTKSCAYAYPRANSSTKSSSKTPYWTSSSDTRTDASP